MSDPTSYIIQTDVRQANLYERGVFYFSGEFSQQSVKEAITWILEANLQQNVPYENLTMIITSQGGDLFAAFALIDVMRGSKIPIHTIGLGIIASAGLLTFIAGEPGERMITPNTSILSHQWSWGSFGKEHELLASNKQFDLITKRIITHYRKCTKLDDKTIREKLLPPQDVWLSGEEAKKYNLVDKIKDLK